MRNLILSAALVLTLGGCTTTTTTTTPDDAAAIATAAIAAAVADANRPAEDVARDAARKPAEMLAFAGVKPGAKVADFIPGGGYFTRIFAKAVGASGHVYAVSPTPPAGSPQAGMPSAVDKIAADAAYGNVSVVPLAGPLTVPEPVDIVWTAQNYHDLHLERLHVDVAAMNKAVFAALKPGGVFVVLDHAALPGTGLDVPDKLHRINPDIVRQEVTAAGFVFEGESTVLRNDTDAHTLGVFDPAIRGKTDQFILKFRKPQ